MSSITQNSKWLEMRARLEPALPFGYRAKYSEARYVLTQCGNLGEECWEKIKVAALSVMESSLTSRLDPSIVAEIVTERTNICESPEGKQNLFTDTNIPLDQLSGLMQRIGKIVQKFDFSIEFSDLPSSGTERKKAVEAHICFAQGIFSNYVYKRIGLKQSESHVAFTGEDLNTFKIPQKNLPCQATLLSCLQFALLKAGEIRAKELIFSTVDHDQNLEKIVFYLTSWGYQQVEEPQIGDFALYFNGEAVKHVGRFLGDCVESKLGIYNPYSHRHNLFAVFPFYGDRLAFYHLPSSK